MKNCLIEELKRYDRWVCWKATPGKDGHITKVPYEAVPAGSKWAKSNDPQTWRPYETTASVANTAGFNGVGFVLGADLPYTCIDLDHCVNRETGEMKEPAATIVTMIREAGGTYIEYSPSGEGLHIWGRGCLPKGHENGLRSKQIELYQGGHYMTVTGKPLDNAPIKDIQSVVETIIEKYDLLKEKTAQVAIPPTSEKIVTNEKYPTTPAAFSDDDLIKVGRRMKDKDGVYKFHLLFDIGDISSYGNDDNRADAALLTETAFLTNGNAEQMGRIFLRSKLAETLSRKQHHEADYLRRSISKALACWEAGGRKHYDPSYFRQGQEITLISPPDPSDDTQPGRQEESTVGQIKILLSKETLRNSEEAALMMKQYGTCVRFCKTFNSWLHYTGKKWEPLTRAEMFNYAKKTIDSIKNAILAEIKNTPGDSERMKDLTAFLNRVITQYDRKPLADIVGRAEGLGPCDAAIFDTASNLLNCDNGVLDLKTGQLQQHKPEQMLMKNTGVAYTGKYHSSLWRDTVADILPDPATRAYMQKALGYALTGSVKRHECYFLKGAGGNGKGIILETVAAVLGDYATTIPIDILLTSRDDKDAGRSPTPQIAKLKGVRLAICSESELGRTFNAATLKYLTGGDRLTGRMLHQNPIEFEPTHKIFFSSNYSPMLKDSNDKGVRRRLVIIPFNVTFSKEAGNLDLNLGEKLATKENHEDVLTWLVEGWQKYQREGLEPSTQMKNEMADYYDSNDYIGDFILNHCDLGEGRKILRSALYGAFRQVYFNECGQYPMSARSFYQIIEKRPGISQKRENGGRYLIGIDLRLKPIS